MKGQQLRLFIGTESSSKCIAASTSEELSVQANAESNTNKDVVDDWETSEIVGKNWSASAEMQFAVTDSTAETAKSILAMIGTEKYVGMYTTSGSQNRTKGTKIAGGQALVVSVRIQSQNKQTVTASVNFQGNGPLS